jgi:MGT family glycosyltransferase
MIGTGMTKAIFFNIPARGHVYPSLGMTAELVRRGEEVIYYSTGKNRGVIEATGAAYRAYSTIDDTFNDTPQLNGTNQELAAEVLMGFSQDMLPELLEVARAEAPDYILHDSMCTWGALVARILEIPTVVSLALWKFTPSMRSRFAEPQGASYESNKGLSHTIRFHQISRQIARRYGIEPLSYEEVFNANGDLTISYSSAEIQPDSHILDPTIHFVGTSVAARGDEPDFPLERLEGRRVIYISLGTVLNKNPEFFQTCMEAFADSPCTVVMGIGNRLDIEALGPIPGNFIVRNSVPPIEILKRSALFISHAGMNSVHEALYLNVPLLLAPQQSEQAITAARVAELGAGLLLEELTASKIRETAEIVLNDPSYRQKAALLGESLRKAGGPLRAADLVMDWAASATRQRL